MVDRSGIGTSFSLSMSVFPCQSFYRCSIFSYHCPLVCDTGSNRQHESQHRSL